MKIIFQLASTVLMLIITANYINCAKIMNMEIDHEKFDDLKRSLGLVNNLISAHLLLFHA